MRLAPVAFVLALSAPAAAAVSTPHPGVTLVTHPGAAMVIADLCAPGVSVRATKYEERKTTPGTWGTNVGLAAAVNADFFDFPAATRVQGRARGAGVDWPANAQNVELGMGEIRQYWQFGPQRAELVAPATIAPAGTATEIVGGHNVIIKGGVSLAPNFDGDGVLFGSYRRTAVGVSKDRAKVYLFASGNLMTGAQLAAAFLAYAQEGGAPSVDVATNEDGGGSSQLWVKGQGQIVDSGRLVANHLGVFATGGGASPMCPSRAPVGYLDGADCTRVWGWTQDPDVPTKSIEVALAFDAVFPDPKARYVRAPADMDRPDVGKVVGSPNHGFEVPTPFALFDGKEHPIAAFGVDAENVRHGLLTGTAKVTCAAAPPPSRKRHVVSETVFAAWAFSDFQDVMPVADDALASMAPGPSVDAPPVLVRGDDGKPEVWLVDGAERRHVTSPSSARAWHFDLSKVEVRPGAEIAALPIGPPLRARPLLAKGSGPAIYLLDALPGEAPGGPGGPGARDGGTGGSAGGDERGAETSGGCSTAPTDSAQGLGAALALLALLFGARRRRA